VVRVLHGGEKKKIADSVEGLRLGGENKGRKNYKRGLTTATGRAEGIGRGLVAAKRLLFLLIVSRSRLWPLLWASQGEKLKRSMVKAG